MTEAESTYDSPKRRIMMLAAQAFALGLTAAWMTIPASAIFLAEYGPELLPVTYIGAACAGAVSSLALSSALRRQPLSAVATRVLIALSALLLASWALLRSGDATWVSFALLVLVPIVVPVGFVFVVGQAGMLLDVRVLKALYARVVAGFALGFVAGGLGGPPMLARFGRPEDLLVAAAAAAGIFTALVVITRRRHPAELSQLEHDEAATERPTLRALTRNRYVMLIVGFQMLSAVESQWLDFLVFDHAAQRYTNSDELAQFVSRFSVIAYGTDIVFLLVLAGVLLRRFGLRYGLTANSLAVLTVLGAIIVAGSFRGMGATIVFLLIVAARVTDLTFADGAARTSLSAAYQAVPNRLRPVAQASVEGLAVPLAIGISGAGLLIVDALGNAGLVLPILTAMVVVAWVVVAVFLYRQYGVSLLANLRGRALDPAHLSVDSESSLVAIDRLVASADERDVRLGLDILTIAQHPELPARLERLVVDERVNVRTDALERLVQLAPHMAADSARDCLDDPSPRVRAASIRVLGAAGSASDLPRLAAHLSDTDAVVKMAVAFAVTRMDDDAARHELSAEVVRLAQSDVAEDRAVAADMLGEYEPGSCVDRARLRALLADRDHHVVSAALAAFREPDEADLFEIARHLDDRRTARAAADALVRCGDAALSVVEEGLRDGGYSRRAQESLVRVAREIGGPSAVTVLRRHVAHPDREVGLTVMAALATLEHFRTSELDLEEPALVHDDLVHATHALRALVAFERQPSAAMQSGALRDELELLRRRVLAALSMRHGTDGLNRVAFQLAQRDPRSHALALEWLDVTLTGTDRAVVALLEPGLSARERLNALTGHFPVAPLSQQELLIDLVQDGDDRWRRPWIKACALYTASGMSEIDLEALAAAVGDAPATFVSDDEEMIVHETLTALLLRRRELA
ncbi:MAG: HEAT repeat domain-containing protein [Acidimicrobiia bacterium]